MFNETRLMGSGTNRKENNIQYPLIASMPSPCCCPSTEVGHADWGSALWAPQATFLWSIYGMARLGGQAGQNRTFGHSTIMPETSKGVKISPALEWAVFRSSPSWTCYKSHLHICCLWLLCRALHTYTTITLVIIIFRIENDYGIVVLVISYGY